MSSRVPQLLSNVFSSSATEVDPQALVRDFVPGPARQELVPPKRRTMIWDLHQSMHCSIIGTCLSTAELRRLLIKLNVADIENADDHESHMLGVMLAGRPDAGAKVLQKALDRRHEAAIRLFTKARDETALTAMWEDALKRGDIPGAYWATLTHPAATDALVKRVFADVHMLSHLVGAANRADIRRLRFLEEENAKLTDKLERQQRQLRDGFVDRDATIRRLNTMLAYAMARAELPPSEEVAYRQVAKDTIADLEQRLARETARGVRLEQRIETLTVALHDTDKAREQAEHQRDLVAAELASIEDQLEALCDADDDGGLALSGRQVLYVGGRAHQVPQLKALVERAGGHFLHHDGGIENNPTLLPGLVSRADWTLFPVDCISHDAMGAVKRTCRQLGKRYLPLRTSSRTCLFSGLLSLGKSTAEC